MSMSNPQTIYCVECLRVLIASGGAVLGDPIYGYPGTNNLHGSPRPTPAAYVIDGTWYCATHALPVYEAAPTHVILEDV
jgi:hypothetical protein